MPDSTETAVNSVIQQIDEEQTCSPVSARSEVEVIDATVPLSQCQHHSFTQFSEYAVLLYTAKAHTVDCSAHHTFFSCRNHPGDYHSVAAAAALLESGHVSSISDNELPVGVTSFFSTPDARFVSLPAFISVLSAFG